MYRQWDPFLPPPGAEMLIPTLWIVPTPWRTRSSSIPGKCAFIISSTMAPRSIPIPSAWGSWTLKPPPAIFTVNQKKVNPDWHIPKQLQDKYQMAVMPAGPDNPMGDYKLGLSWGDYGIHGCNMPWAVGRLVSHGCTRLYPEDIKKLFPMVPMGTKVEYIYEPAKIGFRNGRIFLSVHEDVYFKIRSMILHVLNMLEQRGLPDQVDMRQGDADGGGANRHAHGCHRGEAAVTPASAKYRERRPSLVPRIFIPDIQTLPGGGQFSAPFFGLSGCPRVSWFDFHRMK